MWLHPEAVQTKEEDIQFYLRVEYPLLLFK